MSGYVKIFSEIVDSSIWEEDPKTCKVWITLLALCNCDGYVRGSSGWLAGKARVDKSVCESALEKFKNPDLRSRTPDNDGRRIEQLEDGWLVLNYLAFRDRLSSDPKAVATRERVQKHRERYIALRNKKSVTPSDSASASASEGTSVRKGSGETLYHPDARAVIHILNEATGRHFKELDTNLSIISERLREPEVTLDGIRAMIKRQCERWQNTYQSDYLRPETLFRRCKFDSYYANRDLPVIHETTNHSKPKSLMEKDLIKRQREVDAIDTTLPD